MRPPSFAPMGARTFPVRGGGERDELFLWLFGFFWAEARPRESGPLHGGGERRDSWQCPPGGIS